MFFEYDLNTFVCEILFAN